MDSNISVEKGDRLKERLHSCEKLTETNDRYF